MNNATIIRLPTKWNGGRKAIQDKCKMKNTYNSNGEEICFLLIYDSLVTRTIVSQISLMVIYYPISSQIILYIQV